MGADRVRKPRHEGFHRKVSTPKPARVRFPAVGVRRADNTRIPDTGAIKIFLDDEREMPEGFVIARTISDFRKLLASIDLSRLHTICLDWYLGYRASGSESGHDAVAILVELIEADHARFSGLSSIWLHSTDTDEARAMARTLHLCLFAPDRAHLQARAR
ncbi:cyclic-phosphate processing receiver domain-containing protein [Sphingomonas sp. 3-13AW]|uniref:cyclic-phosphate processing receiver domain-containing protein n=1 Tax=Sphingomonas sp. 3-13AW TaxID=3050450 RepID=UPI003BB800AE